MSVVMNASPGGCGQAGPKSPSHVPSQSSGTGGANRPAVAYRMPSASTMRAP
jgi:hypothetical protein